MDDELNVPGADYDVDIRCQMVMRASGDPCIYKATEHVRLRCRACDSRRLLFVCERCYRIVSHTRVRCKTCDSYDIAMLQL